MSQPATIQHAHATSDAISETVKGPSVAPSPSPPPRLHKHWDGIIRAFLTDAGLTQALRGFDSDMIVMNPDCQRKRIPKAVDDLVESILALKDHQSDTSADGGAKAASEQTSLEDRKLQYLHVVRGAEPKSQTSITKDISKFLARNRARNDASNRQEFLQSLAEKRGGLQHTADDTGPTSTPPSCARTDAKTQDRDVQMKYDIAKNEDGPLRKTLMHRENPPATNAVKGDPQMSYISATRFPGLGGRLQNVESHLAVRYVPSPPKCLLDRIKFLEDHIVQLEKECPPWAALHFNQPRRGWPPPPRPTPIIVPSHLTSTASHDTRSGSQQEQHPQAPEPVAMSVTASGSDSEPTSAKGKGKSGRTKSSLHRAVMEKLEVQKAMHDLAGPSDGG
ncbi:hypothetical protein EVJ58_g3786 [Rhodofomes roseus]|uniref:Uncharacterized protein n=1 Tax=Rhodofomes roseus TaxID=34475 RepID=A0A4Y9YKD8_9APHY|nr:hypothetical protein EVJ58_g3786 [Rhodofomes roseus]